MDCEKFDEDVISDLYGELDEISHAALRRHVDSCARCGPIFSSLKSTREAIVLPLEEPAADLEDRILVAERETQQRAPWHRKLVRGAAWAGSHAMRPQLAMAALLMFVIGSSLLLLRVRPGSVSPVSVSEVGEPTELQQAKRGAPAPTAQSRGRSFSFGDGDGAPGAAPAPDYATPTETGAKEDSDKKKALALDVPNAEECAELLKAEAVDDQMRKSVKGGGAEGKTRFQICSERAEAAAASPAAAESAPAKAAPGSGKPATPSATASASASPR